MTTRTCESGSLEVFVNSGMRGWTKAKCPRWFHWVDMNQRSPTGVRDVAHKLNLDAVDKLVWPSHNSRICD